MHRFDAYSSTSYSRGIRWLPSPEVCRMIRGLIRRIDRGDPNALNSIDPTANAFLFFLFWSTVHKLYFKYRLEPLCSTRIRIIYYMLSCRISRNIGENIFRSYTGTTSVNTDFHVLVA